MADLSNKFTDNKLKIFYANVLSHYKDCLKKGITKPADLCEEMYHSMDWAVKFGGLRDLQPAEKLKVYDAFKAIFCALPVYPQLDENQRNNILKDKLPIIVTIIQEPKYIYRCSDNALLFQWVLLHQICYDVTYHSGGCFSQGSYLWGDCIGSTTHHGGGGSSSSSTDDNSGAGGLLALLAGLAIIAIVVTAALLAMVALFYLLYQSLNSLERFWYGEGWLKAALMLATSVAFGSASTALALTLVAIPLTALAVLAGFNPLSLIIVTAVFMTLIGAGVACLITSLLYGLFSTNGHAIDPTDANRFALTANEEQNLRGKELDPMKVKCAIVALRVEMSATSNDRNGSEKSIPSFWRRHCTSRGGEIQKLLNQVRELRRGELTSVEVGNFKFDCRQESTYNTLPAEPFDSVAPPPSYFSAVAFTS